jgi:deoxycytidylate deaminase
MVGLKEKIYLHAEISALVKCRQEGADTIVVARVNSLGDLRMAKPCPICQLAIKEAKISRIFYSTNNGFVRGFQKS